MKIEDYIASGILESYVLGELSVEEQEKVLTMAKQHPEIKAEIEKVEIGFEVLAQKASIKPDVKLKDSIWQNLEGEDKSVISFNKPNNADKSSKINYFKYAAAAAVMIAIITSYLAYNYYQKWQDTASQLSVISARQAQVAADYQQVTSKLGEIEKDLDIINNAAFDRITLQGTDNVPTAQSTVYWNQKTNELFLNIQALSDITTEFQFQLWAIVDGKPVDAGIIPVDFNGLIPMKRIQGAQAFAITVEKLGGSKTPSLSTMQVYGEVG